MTQEEKLQNAIQRIVQERAKIVSGVEPLSAAQLDFQPTAGSWSIGQVAQHVGLVEQGLAGLCREMFRNAGPGRVYEVSYDQLPLTIQGIPREVTRFAFGLLQPFSFVRRYTPKAVVPYIIANPIVRAKAAPAAEPVQKMDRTEVLAFLAGVRRETLELLESLKDKDVEQYHWLHPLLGYQDLCGTLELIASHDQRHLRQIESTKKDFRFPA